MFIEMSESETLAFLIHTVLKLQNLSVTGVRHDLVTKPPFIIKRILKVLI